MNNTKLVEIQNQQIKGVTLKLMWTVVISTVVITSSVLGTLFSIKSEMQVDRMNAKIRQTEVDSKLEKIELKADNSNVIFDRRLQILEKKLPL